VSSGNWCVRHLQLLIGCSLHKQKKAPQRLFQQQILT
jgi:hypothetical protein